MGQQLGSGSVAVAKAVASTSGDTWFESDQQQSCACICERHRNDINEKQGG